MGSLSPLDDFAAVPSLPLQLSSERLTIRQFRMRDLEEFRALHEDALQHHLAEYSPYAPNRNDDESRKETRQYIIQSLDAWEEERDFRFLIVRNSDKCIVGHIGITQVMRGVAQSAHLGYWTGTNFLSRGYATEACVLGLQFAFEYLRLHRISLWIAPENLASIRVAEKLGLRYEGELKASLFLGGRWQNTKVYSILAEEYETRREEFLRMLHISTE